MACQRTQSCGKFNLHKRHGLFSGFQSLMLALKMPVYSESYGTKYLRMDQVKFAEDTL